MEICFTSGKNAWVYATDVVSHPSVPDGRTYVVCIVNSEAPHFPAKAV